MKIYSIEFSQQAFSDLSAIYLYISQELYSPLLADKIYKKIEQKIESLSTLPLRHAALITVNNEQVRRLMVENYSILYIIRDSSVIIFRIIYTASNMLQKLQ